MPNAAFSAAFIATYVDPKTKLLPTWPDKPKTGSDLAISPKMFIIPYFFCYLVRPWLCWQPPMRQQPQHLLKLLQQTHSILLFPFKKAGFDDVFFVKKYLAIPSLSWRLYFLLSLLPLQTCVLFYEWALTYKVVRVSDQVDGNPIDPLFLLMWRPCIAQVANSWHVERTASTHTPATQLAHSLTAISKIDDVVKWQ